MNPEDTNPIPTISPTPPISDILPTGVATEQQPITPTPTEPSVIPELPKPKRKVLPLLIILFILVLLCILGYWAYQKYLVSPKTTEVANITSTPVATPDQTVDWELYTDTKLGYSIKYPKNTFTVKAATGSGIAINKGPFDGVTVDFQILSRGPTTDPYTALKKETPTCSDLALTTQSIACNPTTEKFLVNNAVGIRVTSHSGLDYYLTDNNNTKPVIRIIIESEVNNSDYETFKTIISTFKFITAAETTNTNFVTKTIPMQRNAEVGPTNFNMDVKIPSDWTFQTASQTTSQDNLIENCSTYTLTSKDMLIKLVLQPLCSGWGAKYSIWPNDYVIALEQKRLFTEGQGIEYRLRLPTSSNNYNYVDATTKDQIMDAITIGYAPPNEATYDFFFVPAHLTVTYSGQSDLKDSYISTADQIAASIALH